MHGEGRPGIPLPRSTLVGIMVPVGGASSVLGGCGATPRTTQVVLGGASVMGTHRLSCLGVTGQQLVAVGVGVGGGGVGVAAWNHDRPVLAWC